MSNHRDIAVQLRAKGRTAVNVAKSLASLPDAATGVANKAAPVLFEASEHSSALIVVLANKITRGSSILFRNHFSVGVIEGRIVATLAAKPSIAPNQIAQEAALDPAAVSRSIRLLEKEKLCTIRRGGSFSRSLEVSLTRKGWRLHDRIVQVVMERERRLLSSLSSKEQAQLLDFLRRMNASVPLLDEPIDIPP